MKKIIYLSLTLCLMVFITACGKKETTTTDTTQTAEKPKSMMGAETEQQKMINDGRGIGEIKMVSLSVPLEQERVKRGKDVYDMKCSSCHKLTSERFVGPGWLGVTTRRKPEWIMNMMLNPMEMTQKDSLAKELLAIYYSQMLDNNLTEEEARSVLEFLRKS